MNYLKVATEIATLLHEKNAAYGDAINRTTQIMEILFPNGFEMRRLKFVLIIVRIVDKLCREATNSDIENWKDIAGYALRVVAEMEKEILEGDHPGLQIQVKFADGKATLDHVCSFAGESIPSTCFGCGKKEPL